MPRTPYSHPDTACPPNPRRDGKEWHCTRCDKLLGVLRDGGLHLRFTRGHEYLVSLPGTCTCRGCMTLNTISGPAGTSAA